MKIKVLDIYGYGKWVNQRFDIDENLQLFFGKNEAGKSTLQSFIRSIFFGFPDRRKRVNQVNRYKPHHSDVYGGRILLTDTPYGNIWIERTSKLFRVYEEGGKELPESTLEQVLGGLDEALYDNFYAFNLKNLQELSTIDSDRLNDYFLSIGTVGSDKFLQVAKNFEKQTDELYRPQASNRPLNQALLEYKSLAERLAVVNSNMQRYNSLVEKQSVEEENVNRLNTEIVQIEKEMRDLDKLLGRYDIYIKDRTVLRELEELVYTDIPDEHIQQLDQSRREIDQARTKIIQLKERINSFQNEINVLTRLNWANNHEEERRKWKADAQKAKEIQSKLEQTIERIHEQNQMMEQLAHRGQFYPERISQNEEYDKKLEKGLVIQSEITNLANKRESVFGERKAFLDHRKEQQNFTAIVRSQAAKLENQRMNEEAVLMQETSLKNYFLGLLFIIIGVVIIALNFNNEGQNTFLMIGGILTGIGILISIYIFYRHHRLFKAFNESPIISKISELREQEVQYHEQSNQLGIQINQRDEALAEIDQQKEQLNKEQKKWLTDIGFYPTADPEIILKTNPVKHYFEAKDKRSIFEEEKIQYMQEILDWKDSIKVMLERFPAEDDGIRALIRHVEEVEVSLTRTQERGNIIQEKIENANNEIAESNTIIEKNEQIIDEILKASSSENEIDFHQKVEVNQRIEELTQTHQLYKDQMVGYEEALAKVVNKNELVATIQKLDQQLNLSREKLLPHQNERANLTVEIQQLEQDGSSQELSQKMENFKTEIKDLIIEWGRKRSAMTLIYQTLRQGLENPIPEMIQLANEIFTTLTYGRYTQIKLNKSGVKVRQFSDILFNLHELSQGTLEQLYVALRLAFVLSASDMVQMPIIIDDAFVNFDEFRKTSMYQVLEKISKDHQILFFTFDEQAKESFRDEQRIDLEVTKEVTSESE